jgi:branched-chain amino acid transport system permease protein
MMRPARALQGVAVAVIVAAPLVLGDYPLALLTYVGLSAIVALGLVLLTGKGGLSSFGQAAYVGIGAYVSAIVTRDYGVSPWLTLPLVLVVVGIAAWLSALVAIRLSGHYLSLGTLAFALAMYFLFGGLEVTGGQNGLPDIPPLSLGEAPRWEPTVDYALVWGALLLAIWALANLLDSRMGRAIRTLRQGAVMAEAMGIDTAAAKTAIFVVAGAMAGASGWAYAHFQRFVNPSPFSLMQGIEYLFMAVLGGAGSLWGAVAGAGIVTLLRQWLQTRLPDLLGVNGNFESVVFGIIILALFQFAPEGLLPRLRRLLGWSEIVPRAVDDGGDLPRRPRAPGGSALLEVDGARKAFGGVVANEDVSLAVASGEIVALIGPNGAGKSTFFDCVTGLTQADRGTFRFQGRPIRGLSSRAIARQGVGRSFQHVRLLPDMSAIENVAIGAHRRGSRGMLAAMLRRDRGEERALFAEAQRQLERVGLGAEAWAEAGSLALGQQRLLEIARALAGDPLLLLLDEPAAGLRHQEKQALAALVRALKADGIGILLVEHDMDFVMSLADRVVVMDFGRRIAEGTPTQVQANPAVLEAYLGGVE